MDPALRLALFATGVFGAGFLFLHLQDLRRWVLQRRLGDITAAARGDEPEDDEASLSVRRAQRPEGLLIVPAALIARLDAAFAAAGSRIGTPHLLIAGIFVGGLVGALLGGFLQFNPVLSLAGAAAAGFGAALLLLREAQAGFRRRFLDLFPEALDLVVRAVKSGLPVLDAMAVAAREIPAPVGPEFHRTLDEMRIGVEMEEAFQRTADRLRIPDFQFFVVSLSLQRRTGGAIAEVLSNLSGVIRRRREIRIRTRALSAEARASAVVLSSMPVVVFAGLYFIRHDLMVTLVADPRGRVLFGLSIGLLLLGIATMTTLVRRSMR
jgi:tight adherence protein B